RAEESRHQQQCIRLHYSLHSGITSTKNEISKAEVGSHLEVVRDESMKDEGVEEKADVVVDEMDQIPSIDTGSSLEAERNDPWKQNERGEGCDELVDTTSHKHGRVRFE
ncbi:hypothetical protein PMAYCL1PPCAC_17248, partial [Pristionchus mayeri]